MTTTSRTLAISGAASGRLLVAVILLPLVLALTGCGPKIKITWSEPKPEIRDGTQVRLAGAEVGKVTRVSTDGGLFTVDVQIFRKSREQVHSESAFFLKPQADNAPAYIEITTLRQESAPISDGAIYKASENRLDVLSRSISSRLSGATVTLAIAAAAVLLVVFFYFRQLGRLAVLVFCLGAGVAGAYYAAPYVVPYFQRWIPADLRPDLLAYVVGFFAAYLVALILVALLRAPLAAANRE